MNPSRTDHLLSFASPSSEDSLLQPVPSVQRVRTSAIFGRTTTHHQHRTPPTRHDPAPTITIIISTACTLIEHSSSYHDPIAVDHCSQSMCHCQHRAVSELLTNRPLDQLIRPTNNAESSTPVLKLSRPDTHALSTLAVASSITKMRLFFSIARARQISCFCPTLRFDPLSLTHDCRPPDIT